MVHSPRALAGVTILLVEDDDDSREILEIFLRAEGATVTTASRAVEAFEVFKASPPAVVLTDIVMPQRDSVWLLGAVRSLFGAPRVPIIALTALAMPEDRAAIMAAGFDAILCH